MYKTSCLPIRHFESFLERLRISNICVLFCGPKYTIAAILYLSYSLGKHSLPCFPKEREMEDVRHKWHCFHPPSPKATSLSLHGRPHTHHNQFLYATVLASGTLWTCTDSHVCNRWCCSSHMHLPKQILLYYKHSSTIVKQHVSFTHIMDLTTINAVTWQLPAFMFKYTPSPMTRSV